MGAEMSYTPKQRMLNAYRGIPSDRAPVAPEFWYYYPAKLLGVDMIEFSREVPFHLALKTTFETFGCEGWGVTFAGIPSEDVDSSGSEQWTHEGRLLVRSTVKTPCGVLSSATLYDRDEPAWPVERSIKELERDLPAFEHLTLANPEKLDAAPMLKARDEVGESYLLEAWLGVPFFDYFGGSREGGFERAIFDLIEHEQRLEVLRQRHTDHLVRLARVLCERTPFESFCIGCSWSNNSLLGPQLWRRWDKPGLRAIADEIHRHGRLLHVHFHGRCMETVGDFAEIPFDCVCPFERPPGGDVATLDDLRECARLLEGRTTFNGNIHTVETLIRGKPDDARREVGEVVTAFADSARLVIGTGDQVGRETPEENLHAMIDEAKSLTRRS